MTTPDNRDEVMPLDHLLSGGPGPLWGAGWEAGIEAQRNSDWRVHTSIVEALRQQLVEAQALLRRIHDRIDALNSEMGTADRFCVLCPASGYSPVEGVIHSLDCPLVLIRKGLEGTP